MNDVEIILIGIYVTILIVVVTQIILFSKWWNWYNSEGKSLRKEIAICNHWLGDSP